MSRQSLILDGVLFAFAASLLMSTQALSDPQETTFYDNVEWAKNAPNNAYSNPNMNINLSDFCADDNPSCESQIRNPAEAGMSDTQITDKSTTEYYSNENAKAIQDNFNNNSYTLDPNDDTYRFATLGIDNAYEISHGQSNPFVDCQSGSQCLIEYSDRSCTAPTYNSVPCYSEPVANVEVGITRYQCPTGWTLKGTTCHGEVEECRYDKRNYVKDDNSFASCSGNYSTYYWWDGKRLSDTSRHSRGNLIWSGGGSYCTSWSTREYEICGPVPVEEPASMTCDAGYTLSGAQCIKNTFTWKSECSLPSECQQVEKICIEGEGTRTINGIPTYLDCWKYQLNHVCDLPNGCDSLPNDCEAQAETSCSLMLNGVCVEQTIPHICSEKQCSETSLLCGEESFCLDGDCFEEMPTTDGSFDESLASLAALADAADGIGDPPMIFTGNAMKCTDKAFGFADCCKDSGWGVGIGLDQCNEEEKALGQAKEQGVTISLGSYCASSFLGACTRKKKTYCVFDSKLARIIQQQGVKGQLGIGLGSAKNPICGAITPEQLQEIDFELIDFSDFYGDMHDNANLPSEEEIKDRLQSAYGN
ncbi:type-F conjugative transfer system mating-pair stabilization protein TraN [Vibrio parahaemolyticus]|uniref:type-F conjugative transfer system mating-pair stabilization protein TraN n=1 Tax=Vibrio parahaemolyticus TaxID=670 RepID=UPI00215C4E1E|nr:type-F conjugative transfer system mating-pair stabilization protein TraN [Vibrio parahaemolyticus]MCR9819764.1 type-F conjugative transfer system mating-pair stabilization protein TraN [Vibrio parahaemolyticus]MDF5667545.1 type-F conjugative transfer system mating-pair stabilization protein TraN [Vibrio parahaemolyticus]